MPSPKQTIKLPSRQQRVGILWMLLGGIGTSLVLFSLNQAIHHNDSKDDSHGTKIDIANLKPPPPSKTIERRPPKRPSKPTQQAQEALPRLSHHISGMDFGIEEMAWLNTADLSEELLGQVSDLTMTADTVDKAPEILDRPPLNYPPEARSRGLSGFVTVNLLIDQKGQVKQTQILEAQPVGVFEQVTLAAIQQWRFQPAEYKGKHVRVWSQQTIRYELN